ncbi:hypothetical protein, unlikely [Trypanosoma brucei gambiense DAL972]|uniref:Uncharacterized protein n=1 Tax=Trypanosoma brucei gambiense (strain MHOM/CI/86/DAL972) TaxID=679716 RepID=D0AA53_TRYB9|nr:hypothetical protein, unlikely [Trypanosoma brucei gambiense DAL972]CBH18554.1 hypothetical protein, unlikely [Trypanosoma brucei gambiense DAL972]|eukprot:XP_011780818.1 hypothetical protein, unlikely [Trypanosoma brucei gambiense DAL972]
MFTNEGSGPEVLRCKYVLCGLHLAVTAHVTPYTSIYPLLCILFSCFKGRNNVCVCVCCRIISADCAVTHSGRCIFFVLFFVVIVVVFPFFFLRCSPSCCVQLRTLHVIEHVCVYLIALKVAT